MEYALYLEYANGRTRSNISRCSSKRELETLLKELYGNTELLELASNIGFDIDGRKAYSASTSLSYEATWAALSGLIKPLGTPKRVRNGAPTTLYLPIELKEIFRERGNGSVSGGLISILKDCNDAEVVKAVTL